MFVRVELINYVQILNIKKGVRRYTNIACEGFLSS